MIPPSLFPLGLCAVAAGILLLQQWTKNFATGSLFPVLNPILLFAVSVFAAVHVFAKYINTTGSARWLLDTAILIGLLGLAICAFYLAVFGWQTLISSEGIRFAYLFELAFAFTCLVSLLHGFSQSTSIEAKVEQHRVEGQNKKLIVVIHGLGGPSTMDDFVAFLRRQWQFGHTDVISLNYLTVKQWYQPGFLHTLSNIGPYDVVTALDQALTGFVKDQDYEEIVLVGHSTGATVTRKLYLYGLNVCSEAELQRTEAASWAEHVNRIVLLSGLNRGFTVSEPPSADVSRFHHASVGLATYLGDLLGIGRYIREFEAGSPFIANMRHDWIEHFASKSRTQREEYLQELQNPEYAPEDPFLGDDDPEFIVVQVRGDIDDIVSADDSHDLSSIESLDGTEFISLTMAGAGHNDLVKLPQPSTGNQNRLEGAFGGGLMAAQAQKRSPDVDTAIDQSVTSYREHRLLTALIAKTDEKHSVDFHGDPDIQRVVVVLHGIRDFGRWAANFHTEFKDMPDIAVENPRYGYFGMGSFLLGAERRKLVKWFMDEITEIKAKYPNAEIDFVGHSNGTYLFAQALSSYESLRVQNVVFAGSVVDKTYDWRDKMEKKQVKNVLNITADSDWVVALFPRFFEYPGIHWTAGRVGGAGFLGFDDVKVPDVRVEGGHSAFQGWIREISTYVKKPDVDAFQATVQGELETAPRPKPWLAFPLSSLLVFAFLAALILWGGIVLITPARQFTPYVALGYTVVVVWLLQRI